MNSIDWKRKLTSRKFWLAVCALVAGLLKLFAIDGGLAEQITGCIMAAAAVIAYTIGEGLADAANAEPPMIVVPDEDEE